MGGIWDYREEREGIYYDISNGDLERKTRFNEKKLFIDTEFENRCKNRKQILGFDIEPIDSLTISLPDYEYEMLIDNEEGPFEINSWIPIATNRIKDPSRIEEYIKKGLIRKK